MEEEKRIKSIVLFIMMAVVVFSVILYVFVVSPRNRRETLGSENLTLELPIQRRDLRYAQEGIIPFCMDGNNGLTFEVTGNSSVYSSALGTIHDVVDNMVIVEIMNDVYLEYEPLSNINVAGGDAVGTSTVLGFSMGDYLTLRLKNDRSKIYECPYLYLDSLDKSVVDQGLEVLNYDGNICECLYLKY